MLFFLSYEQDWKFPVIPVKLVLEKSGNKKPHIRSFSIYHSFLTV